MEEHEQLNLAQQVAHLAQRTAHLEGRLDADERSTPKRVAMWGGLLALVVAISTGAFQLWDGLVLREQVASETKHRELNSYVRRLMELNSHIFRLQSKTLGSTPDPMAVEEINLMTTEKISIVGLADQLLSQNDNIGSFAVLYTLAFEHLNLGNNRKALAYSRKAASISQSNAEAVGAGRYIARALFSPGPIQNMEAARGEFTRTLALARNEKTSRRVGLLTSVYEDWILMEMMYTGACDTAAALLRDMTAEFRIIPNSQPAHSYVRQKVMTYVQSTSSCNEDNFQPQSP